jgi:hypothetical protein
MEEALASRVTAAFRAQRWEERSLQCAKAVIRREMLLVDATNLMERYARDERMCHRRLEVRFDGESGFDAASGTEAGVTRGFYADVAEALLSSEHVSPLNCPVSCLEISGQNYGDMKMKDALSTVECRLPLWSLIWIRATKWRYRPLEQVRTIRLVSTRDRCCRMTL